VNSIDQGLDIDQKGIRFHHLGIAVRAIRRAAPAMMEAMSLTEESDLFIDPVQKVSALFLRSLVSGPRIELIEPASEDSPITRFVRESGGGLHHVCFEVDDLEKTLSDARSRGARVVCAPVVAPGFCGKRIAFCYTREKLLTEFAEGPIVYARGIPFVLAASRPGSQAVEGEK
jgi:methylmalonyl-CoA/ethylmalonyl-CoA epimerase